ncbi:MAG: hypothetical protein Q8877_03555 [Sweet potato little leaf phytoplasma]|nr:hypothetical protein [Sweet potato little leaf phytoplasma]
MLHITAVLEHLSQERNRGGPTEFKGLADFRKCNPPKFGGGFRPDEAQRWIQELEKIFQTIPCTEEQKVTYAAYMLVGEAENWWKYTRQALEHEGRLISWEIFIEKFFEKYFPEDVRNRKEIEFLELKQGSMSVGEYAAKFEELMKYSPYYQYHP